MRELQEKMENQVFKDHLVHQVYLEIEVNVAFLGKEVLQEGQD